MPRRMYFAAHTHSEIQALFAEALGPFGGLSDGPYITRVHAISVGGTKLADSRPRLHKPYSNHYSKEENESLAVAHMLVQLSLDARTVNIVERDKPDREIEFAGGERLFVEVRLIESGQIREGRFLEDANHVLLQTAKRDNLLAERLAKLNVTISLRSLSPTIPMHQLLTDASRFVRAILTREGRNEIVPPVFPALHAAGARAFWKQKKYEQAAIFQKNGAWVDGDYVGAEISKAINEKRLLARRYDRDCTPLWLLLSVADIRPLPATVEHSVQRVFATLTNLDPFSRVVVTSAGMQPQIFDAPS